MGERSQQVLVEGLEKYLKEGYIDPYYINCDSFDECADEVGMYLTALEAIDPKLCNNFRKRIIESPMIWNEDVKASCLSALLWSPSSDRTYVHHYLAKHHDHLPAPIVIEAMHYFCCEKNDHINQRVIPQELVQKIARRYTAIKEENAFDSRFYSRRMAEEYDHFVKAYPSQ